MGRDVFETLELDPADSTRPLRTGLPSAFEVAAQTPEKRPSERWTWLCPWRPPSVEAVQAINQRGWLGHFIRWMPLLGVCVGVVSLFFAVRNFLVLDAQRSWNLLKDLRPSLVNAHNDILAGLAKIQRALNISMPSEPEPPLPPDPTVGKR